MPQTSLVSFAVHIKAKVTVSTSLEAMWTGNKTKTDKIIHVTYSKDIMFLGVTDY